MPYAMDSPFAAASAALGGYVDARNKKKQQDLDNQRNQTLDQQAAADTAARLGLQRSQDAATNAFRTSEATDRAARLKIDQGNANRAAAASAATDAEKAEALKRQKLVDAFQSNGLHYPKNWVGMKPEQQIAYLQVRMNAALKAGDSKTVSNTETEMNRIATAAEQARRDAATAKQRETTNANAAQRIQISLDRGAGGGSDKPLTRYQQIELDHWNKLHLNPDGSLKTNTKDTSGLSSMGNLQYQKDVRDWMMGGQDPATEPDPTSAKYPKKAAGSSGDNAAGGGGRKAMGGYQIGHMYGNLQYLGGDPNDKANWK